MKGPQHERPVMGDCRLVIVVSSGPWTPTEYVYLATVETGSFATAETEALLNQWRQRQRQRLS